MESKCTNFLALQSLPVLLFYMLALASLALCDMHTPYLSDTVRVCWILFCTPLGVFCVFHLESHTVWNCLGSTPRTFLVNTIAYSSVARNGPKSFTNLRCFDSHCRCADVAVGNMLQYVLFITNNKNMKPTL